MDIVRPFIDACCELHDTPNKMSAYVGKTELWEAYLTWADTRPDHKRLDRAGFFEYIQNRGFREKRTEKLRAVIGITLKPEYRRAA